MPRKFFSMERAKMEYDRMEKVDQKTFETLEKRVETLETNYQDLIDNLRIFMVNDDEKQNNEQTI